MGLLNRISPGLFGWLIGLAIPFVMLLLLVEFSADGNALDTIPILHAYDELDIWITMAVLPNLFFFWWWIQKRILVLHNPFLGQQFFGPLLVCC